MQKTGLVADAACKRHLTGQGHPECPARFDAVLRGIQDFVNSDCLHLLASREATQEELQYVHDVGYLALVRHESQKGPGQLSTGDTEFGDNESWPAALRAAGSVMNAVDAVLDGRVRNAFCAVRPPGHHATRNLGMGFCFFNSIAIAARHAQLRRGIERVLIVDWDVHHGNGTQDIFYDDDSVFYFSIHQHPCYPGSGTRSETGLGRGQGYTLNCPVPPGSDGARFLAAIDEELVPAMIDFRPELILISAGFDARVNDPISDCRVHDEEFVAMTQRVMAIAKTYAGERMVSVLEGGYGLEGLASASGRHVATLTR